MVSIDPEKRLFYARLHTAGHVLDACLKAIGREMKPCKANHFPDNPAVGSTSTISLFPDRID